MSSMTLDKVSAGLRNNADDLDRMDMLPVLAHHLRNAADAIDAHLTQPAQSVDVRAEDLQIETFPPDPGGMRVYLPRGVKVTHKPTGITVACVHERSQHANRDTALRALTAALQEKGNG